MDYGTDFKFYNYLNLIDIEKIILFCNIYYWYLVIHCKAITIIIFFLIEKYRSLYAKYIRFCQMC
jgi:hypothetical protein